MTMYQLRVPEHVGLDGWLDEVGWAVWEELKEHSALEALDPHLFPRIREVLEALMAAHVTTYRSCGLWSYCQAGTTPSPWMPPEAFRPDDQRVQWYILEVAQGLDELVTEATDQISEVLFGLLGASLPRSVIEANVETGLQRGIGRYLYENPHCGEHPFCQGAMRVDPWRKELPSWTIEMFPHSTCPCPRSSGSPATE